MMPTLTIALDAMGGDIGPPIILAGAVQALQVHPNLHIIACGNAQQIALNTHELKSDIASRITIFHCQDEITMADKPSFVLRHKKDASMRRAIELVKDGRADACVSAGNTGALFALASYILRTLPGITRPALITSLPTQNSTPVWLLDLGANVSHDAETLFQNAVMGSVLVQHLTDIKHPRIALLNVGEENNKGNAQIKIADSLISHTPSLNYIGYVEGTDLFTGKADVIVTDGFTGNVALKTSEGIAKFLLNEIQRTAQSSWLHKLLSIIALPLFRRLLRKMKADQYNGASLIGLQGIVIKSHGNASANAVFHAIEQAVHEVEQQVPTKIKTTIEDILLE